MIQIMNTKKIAALLMIVMPGRWALPQYKPASEGSVIQFKIKNLGFSVDGSFTGLSGTILFDPNSLAESVFDVSVDAGQINTDNHMRDDHLKKETYFDVEHYPRIQLLSSKITASSKKGVLIFSGKLSIKKQSKDISFPFTAEPYNGGYLFKGSFNLNRKDFDIGGTSTISDMVEVSLSVFAK
jgi:polyisoprenoid-binding protein YceI